MILISISKKEAELKLKKKSSYSFVHYQNITPGAFFKLKKQSLVNKAIEEVDNSNPEEVCEQLANEEIAEKYKINPKFRSKVDVFLNSTRKST